MYVTTATTTTTTTTAAAAVISICIEMVVGQEMLNLCYIDLGIWIFGLT